VNGSVFGEREKLILVDVNPGEKLDVVLEFKAPEVLQLGQSEKLVAFYKLTHGIKKKFGPKIWCDIEVLFPKRKIKRRRKMI
jgi:hypothetical protein